MEIPCTNKVTLSYPSSSILHPVSTEGEGVEDLEDHLTFRITEWGSVITESPKGRSLNVTFSYSPSTQHG